MTDYEKIHADINEKILALTKQHGKILDDKITEVINTFDCSPSQIELWVYPEFRYKIKIKATEFCFDYNFQVEV